MKAQMMRWLISLNFPRAMGRSGIILCLVIASTVSLEGIAQEPGLSLNAGSFTALRMAYSQSTDFDPGWEYDDRRRAVVAAANANDPEELITLGQQWLETCPVDAMTHLVVAQALASIGRMREAARHQYVSWGLIASILESGSGESRDSAMKVISVHEEYYVMSVLQAEKILQAFIDPYDEMTVRINGKEEKLYFDVSIPLETGSKLFDELMGF